MTTRIALAAGLAASTLACAAPDFGTPAQLATAQRPSSAVSADFNGDGLADLALTVDSPDRVLVFFGIGGGEFGAATAIFTGSDTGPEALEAVDLNGDGQPDLVVVLKNQSIVRVYTNNGGAFTQTAQTGTGGEPVSLTAADLDSDGDTDFVVANRGSNSFTIVTNSGGTLASATYFAGEEPRDAVALDLNGDGQLEIAVSNHDDRTITIHAGVGYARQQTIFVNDATRPEGMVAADLDGDGDTDLAAALSDDAFSLASIYLNNGSGLDGAINTPTNGRSSGDITAADFDLDGDMDLITANEDTGNISVLENTGATWAAGVTVPAGVHPDFVLAADLDNNGSPDLAVTARDSSNTWIFLSTAVGGGGNDPCNGADLAEPFGVLDLGDVQGFVTGFTGSDPGADLDGNGVFDLADIQAFIGLFNAGCP